MTKMRNFDFENGSTEPLYIFCILYPNQESLTNSPEVFPFSHFAFAKPKKPLGQGTFPAIGDNKSKSTPFSNNYYSSVSGGYLCFKVLIERVTLTEYNDVNFIEFPDL